jgi:hypothetical protein
MKELGLVASALKGHNEIISDTEADWSVIREGTYFRFKGDMAFYTIASKERLYYIKDFDVLSSSLILVDDNTSIFLQNQDSLTISFKEFECDTVVEIKNGGVNYKIGDKVSVKGGVLSKNLIDNTTQPTTLLVKQIGHAGNITEVSIEKNGKYILPPENECQIIGKGMGAIIELEFSVSDKRGILEREIEKIELNSGQTKITLNFPLPENLKAGKLSIDKWKAFLSADYSGENKLGQSYEMLRDFTPNLNLPLMIKNSVSPEFVFNESMAILDKKLTEIFELLRK